MDLVSARSISVFDNNEAIKDKYTHSNNPSPFKMNAEIFARQRNSDVFIKREELDKRGNSDELK
jgi:hypothetical protein